MELRCIGRNARSDNGLQRQMTFPVSEAPTCRSETEKTSCNDAAEIVPPSHIRYSPGFSRRLCSTSSSLAHANAYHVRCTAALPPGSPRLFRV